MKLKFLSSIGIFGLLVSGGSAKEPTYESTNYKDGKFNNQYINYNIGLAEFWDSVVAYYKDDTKNRVPNNDNVIPVVELTKKDILNFKDNSVVRFGHSTILFKIDNRLVLTDPVFGQRASPFSFFGPKRFHKNPIDVKDMPFIDIIVISHNHYDHFDKYSLEILKDNFGHMYVPLGVKQNMIDIGLDGTKITELDWWDEIVDETITLSATPAQHFSGRGLFDTSKTLWASWVIKSSKTNLFFSGDSGYFKGFKEIGEKYGPFDMTFIENGAYNENWAEIHMIPKESVHAHLDLKGKLMFPIHNGTFELALHSWTEPFERVLAEAGKKKVRVLHPRMGEVIELLKFKETSKWWLK